MKIIRDLFDYQKFEANANLEGLIRETGNRHHISCSGGVELLDDELMLNAAGEEFLSTSDEDGIKL